MASSEHVIGVDQGTSSTKALLVRRDGRIAAAAARPIAISHPRPGWVEQDPDAMVDNAVACVREAIAAGGVDASQVAGLGVCNHTESLVVWDRETGRPARPAIVWQCRRSAAEAEAADSAGSRREIRARTGLDLDPTFTATKLAWIRRHEPDLARRIADGRALWGTVDCWLIWRLTGGAVYATESGNASRTMLYRIDRLAWDPDLASLFGLELGALPEVRRSTGPFGRLDPRFGPEIPIAAALGDQQAALFGHGRHASGEFKCTYGTGAFVWMNAGRAYEPVPDGGYLQTVAWRLDEPTYAREGFVMYAGAVLDWLVRNLGTAEDAEDAIRKAGEAGPTDVVLVPALQGLGSPWWAPGARAALLGMSGSTTAGHVCHAALEAVCYQVRRALEDMSGDGLAIRGGVRVDGGMTRSDAFLRMQAAILGRPVQRAGTEDMTAYGAALMAGLGAGLWSEAEARDLGAEDGGVVEPDPATAEEWAGRYARWSRAADAIVAWAGGDGEAA